MAVIQFTKADVLRSQPLENEKWYSWKLSQIKPPKPSADKQSINTEFVFTLIDTGSDLDGKEIIKMFNSKAPAMMIPLIAALSGKTMDQMEKEGFSIDTDTLVGKNFDGKHILETYEGQLQGRVNSYLPYKTAAGGTAPF